MSVQTTEVRSLHKDDRVIGHGVVVSAKPMAEGTRNKKAYTVVFSTLGTRKRVTKQWSGDHPVMVNRPD